MKAQLSAKSITGSQYELRIDPLEIENLEDLKTGFNEAFDLEDVDYRKVSDYFFRMLEQENPEENEIEEFLENFERSPEDEFLKGIYDGVIENSESEDFFPLDII